MPICKKCGWKTNSNRMFKMHECEPKLAKQEDGVKQPVKQIKSKPATKRR